MKDNRGALGTILPFVTAIGSIFASFFGFEWLFGTEDLWSYGFAVPLGNAGMG